jgi:hypothetical protein
LISFVEFPARDVGLKFIGIPAGRSNVPLVIYIGKWAVPPARQKIVSDVALSFLRSVSFVTSPIHQNVMSNRRQM